MVVFTDSFTTPTPAHFGNEAEFVVTNSYEQLQATEPDHLFRDFSDPALLLAHLL